MSVIIVDSLVKKLRETKGLLEAMTTIKPHEMQHIMEEIRVGRCRKLTQDDMSTLYEEMKEEMLLGTEIHKGYPNYGDEEKYI